MLWKLKAGEERRRHAETYPTYRYTPRRLPQRNRGVATDGRPIGRRAKKTNDPKEVLHQKAAAALVLERTSQGWEVDGIGERDPEDSDLDGDELRLEEDGMYA